MAVYTKYKNLEKPLSTEKYNVGVANKNSDVIDSELHKLDLKNESQDALLATKESLIQHTDNTENPHNVTKSQVGLDNVDNTADMDKPVSAAQREAINDIYTQTNSYVDIKIANLINGAPETLDTLKEIADVIEENETVVDALNEAIGNKANKTDLDKYLPLSGGTLETTNAPILRLKRIGANSSRLQFEGKDGYEITVEGFIDSNGKRTFNVFIEDKDSKSLLKVSELERLIYDYKTKTVKEIMVKGEEAGSCANDFILIIEQALIFTNNICTISDNRITSHSLADVHFTTDTISIAEDADITVETYDGKVELTANNAPTGTIKATIRIRVV